MAPRGPSFKASRAAELLMPGATRSGSLAEVWWCSSSIAASCRRKLFGHGTGHLLVVGGHCLHVLLTQVAGQVCHQIALAKPLAIHLELESRVLPVLTSQVRNSGVPLSIRSVASLAGKDIISGVAVLG